MLIWQVIDMARWLGTKSNFKAVCDANEVEASGVNMKPVAKDPYCEGCKYYSTHTNTCDYILITRFPRQLICPPGKDCTVKVKGKRPKNIGSDGNDYIYIDEE